MPFTLPDLPYAKDAFGNLISAETFDFHHGKHHKAYVDKTNELAAKAGLSGASLSAVIAGARDKGDKPLFNNSAQLWNHSFFWQCLTPAPQQPEGKLAALIGEAFGSTGGLIEKLSAEAVAHFGSGWAWLILNGGRLEVASFHDADTPIAHGVAPLFTLDVWEHAYYIDYRNARPDYVKAVLRQAIAWDFVARNLDGKGAERADQSG